MFIPLITAWFAPITFDVVKTCRDECPISRAAVYGSMSLGVACACLAPTRDHVDIERACLEKV